MKYKVVIPYLQIGEFRVETPAGLSELLEPTWSKPKEQDGIREFTSNFNRTVFRNEKGVLVTRYERKNKL